MAISGEEQKILLKLEGRLVQICIRALIGLLVERAAQQLAHDPSALMVWEPVPLAIYDGRLPEMIQTSWAFIFLALATTGAERDAKSHQRSMSDRHFGILRVWANERWYSPSLVSASDGPIESRWSSSQPGPATRPWCRRRTGSSCRSMPSLRTALSRSAPTMTTLDRLSADVLE